MLVYVTAGPIAAGAPFAAFWRFLSRTNVDRLCVACAMFNGFPMPDPCKGVAAPSGVSVEAGKGVDAPELF